MKTIFLLIISWCATDPWGKRLEEVKYSAVKHVYASKEIAEKHFDTQSNYYNIRTQGYTGAKIVEVPFVGNEVNPEQAFVLTFTMRDIGARSGQIIMPPLVWDNYENAVKSKTLGAQYYLYEHAGEFTGSNLGTFDIIKS